MDGCYEGTDENEVGLWGPLFDQWVEDNAKIFVRCYLWQDLWDWVESLKIEHIYFGSFSFTQNICVYMCVYMCFCVYIRVQVCIWAHVPACVYACVPAYSCACMHVCTYACVHVYTNVCTCIYMCIHICMCVVYMCAYMCMCVHIEIRGQPQMLFPGDLQSVLGTRSQQPEAH